MEQYIIIAKELCALYLIFCKYTPETSSSASVIRHFDDVGHIVHGIDFFR